MAKTFLMHYGTPRHSGRYPYGSGDNPYQHEDSFLSLIRQYRNEGLTEKEIAEAMDMTVSDLRKQKTIQLAEEKAYKINQVQGLKDKGYTNVKIGELLGMPESTVRNLLSEKAKIKADSLSLVKKALINSVDRLDHVDVGPGAEISLNVSRTKLKAALKDLENEGYVINYVQVPQLGTDFKTTVTVLSKPNSKPKDIYDDPTLIKTIDTYISSDDNKIETLHYPESINGSRVLIRYNEEGGIKKDGVIEIRPNVDDLSLGKSDYAQVRIAVDNTHYLKGMAMYSNDIPDGYDIVFNTNKHIGTPKEKVLKELDQDAEINPFGASIKRQNGAINIVNEEGDWNEWSKTIASQMLAKQDMKLVNRQLNLSAAEKESMLEELSLYTNPEVKKKLLIEFADECDAAAVDLKAKAFPGQSTKVILPITSLKEDEIYAPSYDNGQTVALVRYPHGGIFEIPKLTVNNKQKEAKEILGNAIDAVGINSKAAEILSGADFDGDTVIVIPLSDKIKINNKSPLTALKDFDPKESYPKYEGMTIMKESQKGKEMGKITNLITDMTIKGATDDEIARAVKHSMVVIDAVKHELNYKLSEEENGIKALKKKYQGGENRGASTLISKASSKEIVKQRKPYSKIDPKTGEKIWENTEAKSFKTGKFLTTESTKMYEAKDARILSSGTPVEEAYANFANKMKTLGNEARKIAVSTTDRIYNPSMAKTYKNEVDSLNSKLNEALRNAPKERQAQIIANSTYKTILKNNPEMTEDQKKKYRGQCLTAARVKAGAKKERIYIEDREWEAIQSGAITKTKLNAILNNCDSDRVKQLAMPKETVKLTDSKIAKIKSMNASGYTISEIADALGVSTSTISDKLKG